MVGRSLGFHPNGMSPWSSWVAGSTCCLAGLQASLSLGDAQRDPGVARGGEQRADLSGQQIYRPALISVVVLVAGTILPLSKTSANRGLDLSSVPASDREHTQGGPYELCTYTRTDPPQYPPCNPTGVQSS